MPLLQKFRPTARRYRIPRPGIMPNPSIDIPSSSAATTNSPSGIGTKVRGFLREKTYPALCAGLAAPGRRLLVSRGKDITCRMASGSCLVLAPHPDDETLGCGATIMRKLAVKTPVNVVIATDGRHSHHSRRLTPDALIAIREAETRHACGILGLPGENITFLRFEDGRLADHRHALRERLLELVDRINPEQIFVPSIIDRHPDHRVLAEFGRELAQSRQGGITALYEYPIWFWDPRLWSVSVLRALRIRTVRMEEFREHKCAAVAAYRSQIMNLTGEPDWATLTRGFLRQFLQDEEMFFEIFGSGQPMMGLAARNVWHH